MLVLECLLKKHVLFCRKDSQKGDLQSNQIVQLNGEEFEKWCAIRASVSGVSGVLAWVACLHGWGGWRASEVTWLAC